MTKQSVSSQTTPYIPENTKFQEENTFKPEDQNQLKKIHSVISKILGIKRMVIFIAAEAGDLGKDEPIDWWFHTHKYPHKLFKPAHERMKDRCDHFVSNKK